jgi:hypothetical protein
MKERRTDRTQQAANYFAEGFVALFKRYTERTLTPAEFVSAMDELKQAAEANCRKDIIQAFNNGFNHGVLWHVETTSIKKEFDKPNGVDYYRHVFEGGEHEG